ncbi:MAG TPA: hypothetical protein VE092_12670 [Herbaspirillum sp.]|uniref:hypothetical protein n=1 Tax=Herbaspirillum sp. TaxID=1890675 RepID=UPI002D249A03|nr:hypothetical protein [Herbaspirillum sp.]HZG20865.1 hypothetical protein [Herbaspirillum sp.]
MSTMCDSVARQWMALSAARLRWALDAYHEFVASLHDEIKDRFVQNDGTEAYVVVFGRTQVGKTTLLLELMGVLPASLERVSLVLRGGREMGKSATSTAMEYRRSPDHHWRLRMHDGTDKVYENDAGMTAALADVREAMSEGRLQAERPLALAIPDDCFMSDTVHVRQERIRILDLPGDNPKDLAERHHVERMAQTYVPNADLILLVGRADDLSFLNPAALSLHSIRDWRLVPERFRIITTYSFTLASVREKLRLHEGPADAGYFRQALRQEIATFGLDDVESLPAQLFFPLEFGQSWQQAAHQGLELVDRIGPVIAALKDELMRDIRESATEYGRLRSATQVNVIAKRVKEERLKRWNTSLEKRLEDETTLDAQLTHQQKLVAQLDDARQEHARFMTLVQGLVLPDALSVEAMPDAYTKPGKSRDRFTIEIGKRKEALVRHAVKTVELSMCSLFHMGEPVLEEVGAGIEFDVTGLRQCIADAYRALLARLDGYVIDGYHTWTFMSAYEGASRDKANVHT